MITTNWLVAVCLIVQPDNSQLHATLGSLLAAINRYDNSIKAFERAISVAKAQEDQVAIGLYFFASCTNAKAKLTASLLLWQRSVNMSSAV